MRTRLLIISYFFILLLHVVFSWGYVERSMPFPQIPSFSEFLFSFRGLTVSIYSVLVLLQWAIYAVLGFMVARNMLTKRSIFGLIIATAVVLFPSFPAYSHDIYNYIATARVAYIYGENPYIVMPVEISNEPILGYMHAANKVALYGPVWIVLTAVPHMIGSFDPLVSVFTFKAFVLMFYVGIVWLVHRASHNVLATYLLAINPLLVNETLINGHNDVVMMSLVIASFMCLVKKKWSISLVLFFCSVGIKYATIVLFPIYIYILFTQLQGKKVLMSMVWTWSAWLMSIPFLLSPLREEMYPWYFIWILPFSILSQQFGRFFWVSMGVAFGLCFRIAPYLLFRSWEGFTPIIKKLVVIVPFITSLVVYENHNNKV